jgi:hypothetical protein
MAFFENIGHVDPEDFRGPPPPGHALTWNPPLSQLDLRLLAEQALARGPVAEQRARLDPTMFDRATGRHRVVYSPR